MADTLSQRLQRVCEEHATSTALLSRSGGGEFQPTTFRELWSEVATIAAGLAAKGVARGEHVGLISDTRKEWMLVDLAILGLGAVDVPRGSDSTADEIAYILEHADCAVAAVEDAAQLAKLGGVKDRLPKLARAIVLDGTGLDGAALGQARGHGLEVITLDDLVSAGSKHDDPEGLLSAESAKGKPDDIATIIYTSGTTGEPKGVMLTHANFVYQIDVIPEAVPIGPGDLMLSVLPVWHSYERVCEYALLFSGAGIAYSKPIREVMLADLLDANPTYFPSVPRVWEGVRAGVYRTVEAEGGVKAALFKFFVAVGAVHSAMARLLRGRVPRYQVRPRVLDILAAVVPLVLLTPLALLGKVLVFKKITARLGTRFKAGISGAGALPGYVDDFFAAAGIVVLEGYGLTEAAPLVSVRPYHHPVSGTVGPPISGTEVKIVKENGSPALPGEQGVIHVRGPQIMKGYYKRVGDTAAVLSGDGWLDTGDLGTATVTGEISITGRAKDTIVLLGGENIEPEPIEDLVRQSNFVEHIMVVGQDQRQLGALVVPELEALKAHAAAHGVQGDDLATLITQAEIVKLIQAEIQSRVNAKNGFKSFERIARVALIDRSFEIGDELTHTQKMRRHVIAERYAAQISRLFE